MSDNHSKKPICNLSDKEKAYLERISSFGLDFYRFDYNPETQSVAIFDRSGYMMDYGQQYAIMRGLLNFFHFNTQDSIQEFNEIQEQRLAEQELRYQQWASIKPPKKGFVIVYRELATGRCRFTATQHLKDRLKGIQQTLQTDIDVIHQIECTDIKAVKEFLCNKFAEKFGDKNWYDLTPQDIEYIKMGNYPPEIRELLEHT